MCDVPNVTAGSEHSGRMSRQVSWGSRWENIGMNPLNYLGSQTCNTIWVRCPEEVEYQHHAVHLLTTMYEKKSVWCTF